MDEDRDLFGVFGRIIDSERSGWIKWPAAVIVFAVGGVLIVAGIIAYLGLMYWFWSQFV